MKLVMLLTDTVKHTMPKTMREIANWGYVLARFEKDGNAVFYNGDHVYLEDTKENFIEWLKPFDGVIIGEGNPMLQSFSIVHISDTL